MTRWILYGSAIALGALFLLLLGDVESGTGWIIGAAMAWAVAMAAAVAVVLSNRRPTSRPPRHRRYVSDARRLTAQPREPKQIETRPTAIEARR